MVLILFFIQLLILCLTITPLSAAQADSEAHWLRPVPNQGVEIPAPQHCGLCHANKLSQWSGSRHAMAFSPGLAGQLLNSSEDEVKECLNCHAPLAEQQKNVLSQNKKSSHPSKYGVFCAACHLRQGQLITPGKFSKKEAHPKQKSVPWLQESRFCAPCHQFPQSYAINGKPLENTLHEWQSSRFAQQGITCQKCHMPQGQHLFRGIHNQEMVRKGVTITIKKSNKKAVLTLRSTGVGHNLPTYIVPKIVLTGQLFDQNGKKIAASLRNKTVQRVVEYSDNGWQEISDSRLEPGESISISVPWRVGKLIGNKIHFKIVVDPDKYYIDNVYKPLLTGPDGLAKKNIKQADRTARGNTYILYEKIVEQQTTTNPDMS
jgi:hypothetical protein